MLIEELIWDERNEAHISRHHVTPEEVEQACSCRRPLAYRVRSNDYALLGRTLDGRFLLVILAAIGGGTYRPVTARDMTKTERARYEKWLGR
ncbi:MAG: BrnT family toxin [Chloroflexi bacterium]|nr:MAG: BrnT family toxin [Chloroflexota bacterium]